MIPVPDLNSALLSLSLSLEQLGKSVTGPQGQLVEKGEPIKRSTMFESIMGIGEARFKLMFGVTQAPDVYKMQASIQVGFEHIQVHGDIEGVTPKKFFMLEGSKFFAPVKGRQCWQNFGAPTVGTIWGQMYAQENVSKLWGGGRLFILLKSREPKKADVRWLQEHFPGAVFQIASTFACLEGGAIEYQSDLNEMAERPVQGEDAVLATITGAIIRKYLVPITPLGGNPKVFVPQATARDLLRNVRNVFTFHDKNLKSHLAFRIRNTKQNLNLNKLENNIRIGIHRNVWVTSGPLDPEITNLSGRKEYDRRLDEPHTVHQIFAAAIDLNGKHENPPDDIQKLIASGAPEAILRGMYRGTIAAAWDILIREQGLERMAFSLADFMGEKTLDMPRLFITMVGAGAFRNDPRWIVKILKDLKEDIVASGLQVCLVVWDDHGTPPWVGELEKHFAVS